MRDQPFPSCCGARLITELSYTESYEGAPTKVTPKNLNIFLQTQKRKLIERRQVFTVSIMNNYQADQEGLHEVFLKNGWSCVARDFYHPNHDSLVNMYVLAITYDGSPQKGSGHQKDKKHSVSEIEPVPFDR